MNSANSPERIEALASIVVDQGLRLHKAIGPGLLESAYETFLAASLAKQGLRVERQRPLAARYEDITIEEAYRIDLLVENSLIVEIKSVEKLAPIHAKQLLTYLRLARLPLGLLLNFNVELFRDGVRRVIDSRSDYVASK